MRRSKRHLSETFVKDLRKPQKIVRHWDAEQRGFAIQVTPNGAKSWIVQFTKPDGKKASLTIGSYPETSLEDARKEAHRLHVIHKADGDIKAAHRNPNPDSKNNVIFTTLREVALLWWEKRKSSYKPTTQQSYKSILYNVILKSELAEKPIKIIEFEDIENLFSNEQQKHPIQANRTIPILSKIFKYAEQYKHRDQNTNVCKLFERPTEHSRDRVLSPKEFVKFYNAVEILRKDGIRDRDKQLSDTIADMFMFCAYSGLRPREAKLIKWSQIENDPPHIVIKDHKTQNKTENKPKFIPLNSYLIQILNSRKKFKINEYVFNGRKRDGNITGYARPWLMICETAKLKDFHLHDFRRIFRTRCLEFRYTDSVADALLGHRLGKVRGTYTQFDPDGIIAEASQKVSEWIHSQMKADLKN